MWLWRYWDAAGAQWVFAQYLTSDQPVHTHVLEHPIEARRFRLTRPDGAGWPASNLRLAEIVVHGEALGGSHPDVIQNRRVALLFDEKAEDLMALKSGFCPQFEFRTGDGASGATYMALKAEGAAYPSFVPPFGHAIPNWDFEIVENPTVPDQYRWLEFAYRALAPETRGIDVSVGGTRNLVVTVGERGESRPHRKNIVVNDKLSTEWTTVRVDLWQAMSDANADNPNVNGAFTITRLDLASRGGPAGFDRIRLGRAEGNFGDKEGE